MERTVKEVLYLDVIGDDRDVLEVQSCINLVHDVEGRGLVVVEGEDQRQGAQCLLPSRQVRDLLPGFLRWPHAEIQSLLPQQQFA